MQKLLELSSSLGMELGSDVDDDEQMIPCRGDTEEEESRRWWWLIPTCEGDVMIVEIDGW